MKRSASQSPSTRPSAADARAARRDPAPSPGADEVLSSLNADNGASATPNNASDLTQTKLLHQTGGALGASASWKKDAFPQIDGFDILEELGRGGMGVVYRALKRNLQVEVALKLLNAADVFRAYSRSVLERFEQEARAAAGLKHPNLVAVSDFGECARGPYYVMDLVRGPSAAALIRKLADARAHRLPAAKLLRAAGLEPANLLPELRDALNGPQPYYRLAAAWTAAIADALGRAHAHAPRILHRDIKPGNLLLAPDGRMMLSDFGLAKIEGGPELTNFHGPLGTVMYLAPEVISGGNFSPASDLYALGLTFYEFLTHQPAYDGIVIPEIIAQIASKSPPKPRAVAPHVPRELESICWKAIARDPAERYASMDAFAAALRKWLKDAPRERRNDGFWKRRAAAVTVVTGLLALGGAGYAYRTEIAAFLENPRNQVAVDVALPSLSRHSAAREKETSKIQSDFLDRSRDRQEAAATTNPAVSSAPPLPDGCGPDFKNGFWDAPLAARRRTDTPQRAEPPVAENVEPDAGRAVAVGGVAQVRVEPNTSQDSQDRATRAPRNAPAEQAPPSPQPPTVLLAFLEDTNTRDAHPPALGGVAADRIRTFLQEKEKNQELTLKDALIPPGGENLEALQAAALRAAQQTGAQFVVVGETTAEPLGDVDSAYAGRGRRWGVTLTVRVLRVATGEVVFHPPAYRPAGGAAETVWSETFHDSGVLTELAQQARRDIYAAIGQATR